MSDLFGGALVSELLKLVIAEAKKVNDFKALSEGLVSTMERLLPLTEKMESLQNELGHDVDELKELRETMERAQTVVQKCSRVGRLSLKKSSLKKSNLTRQIEQVNKDLIRFCQLDLQLIQSRNHLQSLRLLRNVLDSVEDLSKRVKGLSVSPPVLTDLCSVPELGVYPVGLGRPLVDLRQRLLDDHVVGLVVSAPPGCGKTTLVTQLCHDAKIKGKFKHIFFTVVSSTLNLRLIVQNLLQHNGCFPLTFENDSQAIVVALRNLLQKLNEDGHILLVLDDVWHGSESLLENFRVDLPGYKILVTSRFDFPLFGSTYRLKPVGDEDAEVVFSLLS